MEWKCNKGRQTVPSNARAISAVLAADCIARLIGFDFIYVDCHGAPLREPPEFYRNWPAQLAASTMFDVFFLVSS
jgi:hypothetical protein